MRGAMKFGGVPRIRWGATPVNIVADGNSIMAGAYAALPSSYIPTVACATWPVSAAGITPINVAIGGQTTNNMISNHADVDAAWQAGKKNILCLFEGTNQISVGSTGAEAIALIGNYVSAVQSAHPWTVIMMTVTPGRRTTDAPPRTVDQLNAEFDSFNTLLRSNYRDFGIHYVCESRPAGGPYDMPNYSLSEFQARQAYFASHETTNQLHPSDLGYQYLGRRLAATLATVRAR